MNTKNLKKRAEVIELRKSGLSFKQIAQQMGYKNANPSYVRKICQENGLDMTIAQKHEAMREYKAQGHSHKEVAEHFGVSEATSYKACKGVAPQTDIFVVGAMYPSIDHVKPISKGGLHEWGNVQLAHFSCNSKKGDKA